MFFCPKCNFSLDLSKNIPSEISGDIQLKAPKDFIDMAVEDDIDGNIKLVFSKKELFSAREYKKLSDDEKDLVNKKFQEINNVSFNLAYFICKNCQFVTKLEQGTKVYEVSINSKFLENEIIENKLYDLTLPRTKDYICPNKKCATHKNMSIKEALFYRPYKNSYNLKYVCNVCKVSWLTGNNKTA